MRRQTCADDCSVCGRACVAPPPGTRPPPDSPDFLGFQMARFSEFSGFSIYYFREWSPDSLNPSTHGMIRDEDPPESSKRNSRIGEKRCKLKTSSPTGVQLKRRTLLAAASLWAISVVLLFFVMSDSRTVTHLYHQAAEDLVGPGGLCMTALAGWFISLICLVVHPLHALADPWGELLWRGLRRDLAGHGVYGALCG